MPDLNELPAWAVLALGIPAIVVGGAVFIVYAPFKGVRDGLRARRQRKERDDD